MVWLKGKEQNLTTMPNAKYHVNYSRSTRKGWVRTWFWADSENETKLFNPKLNKAKWLGWALVLQSPLHYSPFTPMEKNKFLSPQKIYWDEILEISSTSPNFIVELDLVNPIFSGN